MTPTSLPFSADSGFIRELAELLSRHEEAAGAPTPAQLGDLVNAAFWASLKTEEGHRVALSLVVAPPEAIPERGKYIFSTPLDFSPYEIAKLSAGFPGGQNCLGVSIEEEMEAARIWGFCMSVEASPLSIDVIAPGYIVIRSHQYIVGAVLPDGSPAIFGYYEPQDAWVDHMISHTGAVRTLQPFESRAQAFSFLKVIAGAMRQHERGGTLLLVDDDDRSWERSLDFRYRFPGGCGHIPDLVTAYRQRRRQDRSRLSLPSSSERPNSDPIFLPDCAEASQLRHGLRFVGGLTAVDGALVMTKRFDVVGYGAKIKYAAPAAPDLLELIPIREQQPRPLSFAAVGGMRHRSAAQFVTEHMRSLAFVASQDGRFTVFSYENDRGKVMAIRADLLLL